MQKAGPDRYGTRGFRLASWGLAVLLFATVGVAGEPAAPAAPEKVETLEGLVGELLVLELEDKKEREAWAEQERHLTAIQSVLADEKERLTKQLAAIDSRKQEEESERERLARTIAERNESLLRVAKAATGTARDLLAQYEALPAPLRRELTPAAEMLRTTLKDDTTASHALKRLRMAVGFGHDLQRTLSAVHLVKEVIEVREGDKREADVLYLGGTVGFYLLPSGQGAGVLRRKDGGWLVEKRDGIADRVARGMAVKRKEKPPALTRLPVRTDPSEVGDE